MDTKTANMFYEIMCGTTSGHMANVPTNPVIYALFSAYADSNHTNCHACTKEEFSDLLFQISEAIKGK